MASRMEQIPFSGIREVFERCDRLEAEGTDVVHLEIGRPDFDTPEPIKRAAIRAIEDGHVHYTSNYGIASLREEIVEKFESENGLRFGTDEVVVTCGATEAVFLTILAHVNPGDEVLVPDPSWTYEPAIRAAGATPVYYTLDPSTGFHPDVESLQERVSPRTKLLVVNTPHNPTGTVLNRQELDGLGDVVVDNDLLVLADEIYEKILYEGTHASIGTLDGMADRTITVSGVSKAYSMTGWRLGYLGATGDLLDPIIRMRQYTSTCAPSISQHAARRALQGDEHTDLVRTFEERRDTVIERIDRIPAMSCPHPNGAFYAFPTVPTDADSREFVYDLLEEAGVATVPGPIFGAIGDGRFRIAYSTSGKRINEAFDRIESWIG